MAKKYHYILSITSDPLNDLGLFIDEEKLK